MKHDSDTWTTSEVLPFYTHTSLSMPHPHLYSASNDLEQTLMEHSHPASAAAGLPEVGRLRKEVTRQPSKHVPYNGLYSRNAFL